MCIQAQRKAWREIRIRDREGSGGGEKRAQVGGLKWTRHGSLRSEWAVPRSLRQGTKGSGPLLACQSNQDVLGTAHSLFPQFHSASIAFTPIRPG